MFARSESSVTSRMSMPSIVIAAAGDVVEARQQVDDRRLAAAGRAEQGDDLARLRLEVDVAEHGADRVVAEGDVVEAHVALDVRQRDGVRLLLDRGLGVEDLEDALAGGAGARELLDDEAEHAHRHGSGASGRRGRR